MPAPKKTNLQLRPSTRCMDDEVVEGIPRGPSQPLGPARPGCLPFRLFMIMQVIATAFVAPPPFSCVDCFAGRRAISRAFVGHGEPAVALDIILTPNDDILSPLGFIRHVYAAMNLKRGGLLFAGVVCSTFSIVNRGTSGRTLEDPLGRQFYKSVAKGNLMLVRAVLLFMICIFNGATWVMENPSTSIIFEMPRFKELIKRWGGHALNMWLGMYGAPTWKMVKLFSSDPFIYRLFRKLDKSQFPKSRSTVRYTDGKGQKKFKGSPLLKATQVYTPSFGNAVYRNFTTYARCSPDPCHELDYADSWDDAKLGEVEDYLYQMLKERNQG